MTDQVFNVLFLCTANSARSIIAEAILNRDGQNPSNGSRFRSFSAGSHPRGAVLPAALALLTRLNYPTAGLRSKSWDEFAAPGAPVMDFVFTVCDNAAEEICPHWPGQPMSAYWGLPNPAEVTGSEAAQHHALVFTHQILRNRISLFTNLPLTSLDRLKLQTRLDEIGRSPPNPV